MCEIFDVNNPDKSPTCHSTVVTPATQSVSYKTATKTTNNSGGNMLNDPKMVLREEEEEVRVYGKTGVTPHVRTYFNFIFYFKYIGFKVLSLGL